MPSMTNEELQRLAPQLALIASLAPVAAAAMIEVFDVVPLSADEKRYLVAPIVVHEGGGWGREHIPRWMLPQIHMERAEIVLGLHPEWLVGPTEIVAVMHAATLTAPLISELGDLYVWATMHATARWKSMPVAEMWSTLLPVDRVTTDDQVLKPKGRLYHHYTAIAREIRGKVNRVQEVRDRATRRAVAA